VDDVDKKFKALEKLQQNNWKAGDPGVPAKTKRKTTNNV